MRLTDYHAKYYAWELTRRRTGDDVDRLSQSLFDATVDLNPHQIDAAVFALSNPLSKGVLLADEVGLGKTIEAALVISQYWAERRRRILVICPASLRKQWAQELAEKFHLPTQVLDAQRWRALQKADIADPLAMETISVMSLNYATRLEEELRANPWDLVVIDEAHKLRNAHRDSHRTGQALRRALAGVRKLLLTATPLQNSLLELYGLSTILDEHLFGDRSSFQRQFMHGGDDIPALRRRLQGFVHRTLRRQVLEYVQYTQRRALTIPFTPNPDEQRLYDLVSGYLSRQDSYGFPSRQRHLIRLVLRKLLASSTSAIIKTLETMHTRLVRMRDQENVDDDWFTRLVDDEDLEDELLEDDDDNATNTFDERSERAADETIDRDRLNGEIAELDQYIHLARSIPEDAKSHALLHALTAGFEQMAGMAAPRKAVIFTESRRTQDYLAGFLESHGFAGKVVTFSGNNRSETTAGIVQRWLAQHAGSDRVTGSPAVDRRTALIDWFRDKGEILIATEAGAEGINLQFCAQVINYDLPWNPQRVEQRIGRCHRYGQQFDVVVINFLNQRNDADARVLQLLQDKFELFDGVFGASDSILGRLETGTDIERRIADIYNTCRTADEIQEAFDTLQTELEESITARMAQTEAALLEHFDASIHDRLKTRQIRAEQQLDRIARLFWRLTQHVLAADAKFDNTALEFSLPKPPVGDAPDGQYRMIRKGESAPEHAHLYRMSHPLGQYVLDTGRRCETPRHEILFDYAAYGYKISVLDDLRTESGGSTGWLSLNVLSLSSFAEEEHLVFTAQADNGARLDHETCERLFDLPGHVEDTVADEPPENFAADTRQQLKAALNAALEDNNQLFQTERDKLDQWAEDQILAAEKALDDTKLKIRSAKREGRTASTVEEQKQAQETVRQLERQQRRQRQQIFQVEDEIDSRRDQLIDALEQQLHRKSTSHHLFTIRWRLA